MSVVQWFLIGVATTAYLIAWRYAAGVLAWRMAIYNKPEAMAILGGVVFGFFVAWIVPIIFVVGLLGDNGLHLALQRFMLRKVLYVPKGERSALS